MLPAGLSHREGRKATMLGFIARRKVLIAVLLVPVVAGGAWFAFGASRRPPKEALPPPAGLTPRDAGAMLVTTEPVVFRRVERTVEAVGTLCACEDVTI